jgi:hypothetical protein
MENIKVNDIIAKLQKGELDSPNELANYLVILSASLNTAGNFELEAEINYAKKWEEIKLSAEMTDKMADAKTKQTDEYRMWKEMQIANKTILQTIMALKKKLLSLNQEYLSGQNYG